MPLPATFIPRPPSLSAKVARLVTKLALRPMEHVIPDSPLGVRATRRILAALMAGASLSARDIKIETVERRTSSGRVKGEWARPLEPTADGVVLYIHGSGYALCSTKTHRPLVTRLARETNRTIFSVEYRLAPEHPFPAAPDDVARAYDWLLDQGWSADRVVVAGDSAGGHLAVDLALELHRAGRQLPAGLVLWSPLADLTCDLMAERELTVPDPMISAARVRRLLRFYLVDTDPKHPRITHVLDKADSLPPTLIQAGGAEFLAADAEHLAAMLAAAGTDVTLEVWPGQMHVFQAASRFIPEADAALKRSARFVNRCLNDTGALLQTEKGTA